MALRCFTAPLLLFLLLSSASAQSRSGNLKVRVTFPDGRPCNIRVHVQLMGSASTSPVAEGYTNDAGVAEFNNVEIGNYHLIVTGEGIEETDSGAFEVDPRRASQFLYVTVKPLRNTAETNGDIPGNSTVSAADINIPENAAKEFDKAAALMAKQDWSKAIERLKHALAIYPRYAAAYNNLGIAYARTGDRPREREALQKAIEVSDHFAPALVNLAKMSIADRDFPAARPLLEKAVAADPVNSQTLILLANVELLQRQYDQAIANCRKVHSLSGQGSHALAHYIAARALQHQNRSADSIQELQTFLQEEPSGKRADAVRAELARLQDR